MSQSSAIPTTSTLSTDSIRVGTGPSSQVAVVGCGKWGKNLVRNFNNLGFLGGICDARPEVTESFQQEYKEAFVTSDFDAILARPDIAGVVIATPSHTHYPLGKKALLAGKHVYVEKPAATKVRDIQELFRLSEERGLVLMVGHLLLYHPAVNRLKQLIEEGYLGKVTYIQSERLNFNPFRSDSSVLWDLAPHDLSMISYVLDAEPEALVSVTGNRTSGDGIVDIARMELQFPNGVSGHIHTSWVHPTKHVKLMVRGTLRTAVLDDTLNTGKLQIFGKDEQNNSFTETPEYLTIEPLKLECQHFINCIRSGKTPNTDGINGTNVVKILEEAEERLATESLQV